MRLVKSDLRNYFNDKFRSRYKEVEDEVVKIIEAVIDPVIDEMVKSSNTEKVEELGNKFNQEFEKIVEEYNLGWEFKRVISNINSNVIGMGNKIKSDIKTVAMSAIRNPSYSHYDSGNKKLNECVIQLQKTCKPYYDKISSLHKLEKEISKIIDTSPNAKKAYDFLLDQNVDMKDLKVNGTYLPAISKLSVDVCVLNKTC